MFLQLMIFQKISSSNSLEHDGLFSLEDILQDILFIEITNSCIDVLEFLFLVFLNFFIQMIDQEFPLLSFFFILMLVWIMFDVGDLINEFEEHIFQLVEVIAYRFFVSLDQNLLDYFRFLENAHLLHTNGQIHQLRKQLKHRCQTIHQIWI